MPNIHKENGIRGRDAREEREGEEGGGAYDLNVVTVKNSHNRYPSNKHIYILKSDGNETKNH